MNESTLYFDFNANTPLAPEVVGLMTEMMSKGLGNPSSGYESGLRAKTYLEQARKQVAGLIGAHADEIIFTSGGTESNNTVLKGLAHALKEKGNHIVTSAIEHPAILEPLCYLSDCGVDSTILPVDEYGIVDPALVENAIRPETILVTIMHANNEVGTIQPVKEIARIAKARGALFHTDASQSIGKLPVDVEDIDVDYLTIAGHKLYAPEGIGALYVRRGVPYASLLHGGGQESGHRAGTENVLFAAALGCACALMQNEMQEKSAEIRTLRDSLENSLRNGLGERLVLNGHPEKRLPNTLHISILGVDGNEILSRSPHLSASTGSACHSGRVNLSPVLSAMGCSEDRGRGAIRLSLGRTTTKEDVQDVAEHILKVVGH